MLQTFRLFNPEKMDSLATRKIPVTTDRWGPTGLLNRTNLQTDREIWYLFKVYGNVVTQSLPCINQAIISRHITLVLHARLSHR